ncbi:hypothetical protein [Brevundimonas sp.]|uniref:hypothetical protein n=1 Tax=Brevundimonas sp. TaxID=1871086 RepID=UPI003AFF9458
MTSTTRALPTATTPKSRHMRINDASYRMLDFLSSMRGEPKGLMLYRLLREQLAVYQEETAWSPAPPPFVIKPTFGLKVGNAVLLYNPFIDAAVLTGKEAVALADAITQSLEGRSVSTFQIVTEEHGHTIRLKPAGRRIHLIINATDFPMALPVARDVAAALDSASVHATEPTAAPTVH